MSHTGSQGPYVMEPDNSYTLIRDFFSARDIRLATIVTCSEHGKLLRRGYGSSSKLPEKTNW